jgi:1-acyl-sn-glycerol-3-phosphate acyltransferase
MRPIYRLAWLGARLIFRGCFQTRYHNPERLPSTGPVILAANHVSYLDPPLVGSGLHRPVNYLARENLFKYAPSAALLRALNCVPVDRDGAGAAGLKGILDRLSAGGVILLFPEGTRSRDGRLQPARAGIGLTVIKSQAPVLPIRVFGTFEAYNRYHRFPRPRPLAVKYGRPMLFAEQRLEVKTASKARVKEIYQEVADRLMAEIAALQPFDDVDRFG